MKPRSIITLQTSRVSKKTQPYYLSSARRICAHCPPSQLNISQTKYILSHRPPVSKDSFSHQRLSMPLAVINVDPSLASHLSAPIACHSKCMSAHCHQRCSVFQRPPRPLGLK